MQPLIPQATKKRLFVMRSVEVWLQTNGVGWGSSLSRLQRLLQELSHHMSTVQHPNCLVAVLLMNTRFAYAH